MNKLNTDFIESMRVEKPAAQWHCGGHFFITKRDENEYWYTYYCCDYEHCNNDEYETYNSLEDLVEGMGELLETDMLWVKSEDN